MTPSGQCEAGVYTRIEVEAWPLYGRKMSYLSDVEAFATHLRNSAEREVGVAAAALERMAAEFAKDLAIEGEKQYRNLKVDMIDLKSDVDKELVKFGADMEILKTKAEGVASRAIADADVKLKRLADTLSKAGLTAVGSIETASSYVRGKMVQDLTKVLDNIRQAFDAAETAFRSALSKHANDFIAFTKTELSGATSNASADLVNIKNLGDDLKKRLVSEIDGIKVDLDAAKSKLSTDINRVITFGKSEVAKLESRVSGVASGFEDFGKRAGLFAIGGAFLFLGFEFLRKNMQTSAEDDE